MAVTPDEVRQVAALARLALPDERVDALAAELSGILGHMDVLAQAASAGADPEAPSPEGAPWREDAASADASPMALDTFAPAVRDGFFTVPRLASHEDAGA